jgi:hypothetical protein
VKYHLLADSKRSGIVVQAEGVKLHFISEFKHGIERRQPGAVP